MATYILQYWRHSCHHRTVILLVLLYWLQVRRLFHYYKCAQHNIEQNSDMADCWQMSAPTPKYDLLLLIQSLRKIHLGLMKNYPCLTSRG